MRVAIVTTPPSEPSPVGERTRALLPRLRDHCDVEEFVERGRVGIGWDGRPNHSSDQLRARDFDHIVFQLGNEELHAFMLPILRVLGGTVMQHEWRLTELAVAARPLLLRGGFWGALAALREGGVREARTYAALCRGVRGATAIRERITSPRATDLVLNRSVVRHADAFLVESDEMKHRILVERNSATPIVVLSCAVETNANDWSAIARQVVASLDVFPAPRSRRKSLIQAAVAAADRGGRSSET